MAPCCLLRVGTGLVHGGEGCFLICVPSVAHVGLRQLTRRRKGECHQRLATTRTSPCRRFKLPEALRAARLVCTLARVVILALIASQAFLPHGKIAG